MRGNTMLRLIDKGLLVFVSGVIGVFYFEKVVRGVCLFIVNTQGIIN